MHKQQESNPFQKLIPGVLLATLLFLSFKVLSEFLLTLIWALILTYVTWPVYRKLRIHFDGHKTISAAIMTLLISTFILLTLFFLASLLQEELKTAYLALSTNFSQGNYQLSKEITEIPWLGPYLQEWLDRMSSDKTGITTQLANWMKQWIGEFAEFLKNFGRYVIKLAVILTTLFFCFRDGDEALKQLKKGVVRFLGQHQDVYLQAVGHTTRAVVYGLVLAALGQGVLAGIGYYVAGVEAPVLFGVATAIFAMVPMGATLIWMPIGIALIVANQLWAGVGLLLWGFLVVSTVDNIIRPLVISGTSRVPFLIVMFGVLGGLNAFGAIGIFLGPVILAVLLAVWQAWLAQQTQYISKQDKSTSNDKKDETKFNLPDED